MRKTVLTVLGVLLIVLAAAVSGDVEDSSTLEAKLDSLATTLHGFFHSADADGEREWLSLIHDSIEQIRQDWSEFETKTLLNLQVIAVALETGEGFTDDVELSAHEAAVITEINENQGKIDAIKTKLDDSDTGLASIINGIDNNKEKIDTVDAYVDEIEILLTHWTYGLEALDNDLSVIDGIVHEIEDYTDQVEGYVDEVESLLKDGTYGLSALEGLVDNVETKLNADSDWVDEAELDAALDQLKSDLQNWMVTHCTNCT